MSFEHDSAPEAEGVGFVEDEVEAAGDGAPFVLKDCQVAWAAAAISSGAAPRGRPCGAR